MQEANKATNDEFSGALTKVIETFNKGGGGAARIELGQFYNVAIDSVTIRKGQGATVSSESRIESPHIITIFSPEMMMLSIEGAGEADKHKISAFRNRIRRVGPKLFELESMGSRTELYFG